MEMNEIFDKGFSYLNEYQQDIFIECITKKNGCISIPMGSGKTLIGLLVAISQKIEIGSPILVVLSKTLIYSWVSEIQKFFGDALKYVIYHKENLKNFSTYTLEPDVQVVITTPQVLEKQYSDNRISDNFIHREIVNERMFNQHEILHYLVPERPFVNESFIYSIKWGTLLIDEAQDYTNIKTKRSQSIAAICAHYRWCLSGTIFNEPDVYRILGYYLFINDKTFPDNIPKAREYIYSTQFKGLKHSMVVRTKIPMNIQIKEKIISVEFNEHEKKIYLMMRSIIFEIHNEVKISKENGDTDAVRQFNACLLSMLTYLRQCIVSPLIPLSALAIDMIDLNNYLANKLSNKLKELDLNSYLENKKSIKSSRFKAVLKKIKKHKKIVIFTCYRTSLNVLKHLIEKKYNRLVLSLDSEFSSKKRGQIIEEFNEADDVIFLLTYKIGSNGLNLQTGNTIMLLDYEWSYGITKQAIARIARQGQKAEKVYVYYFTSNTGVENAILQKQTEKIQMLNELNEGAIESKLEKIKLKDIITLLENEECEEKLKNLIL